MTCVAYEPLRLLNDGDALDDWSAFGITKDTDGYLWMLGSAVGRETQLLVEDRRFTSRGKFSVKNTGIQAERTATAAGNPLMAGGPLDEKILHLLSRHLYAPLVAEREAAIEAAILIWRDSSLSREEKQRRIGELRQSFIESVDGFAERLKKEAEEKQRAAESRKKEAADRAERERQYYLARTRELVERERLLCARRAEEMAARQKLVSVWQAEQDAARSPIMSVWREAQMSPEQLQSVASSVRNQLNGMKASWTD